MAAAAAEAVGDGLALRCMERERQADRRTDVKCLYTYLCTRLRAFFQAAASASPSPSHSSYLQQTAD